MRIITPVPASPIGSLADTGILPSATLRSGLHQPEEAVQARVFYLFSRFIHQAKGIVQSQVSGDLVRSILSGMQVRKVQSPRSSVHQL